MAIPIPTVLNTAVPTPTVADVYSAGNVAQATTAPVQAPMSAEQQLYSQFLETPDIQTARANVSAIQKQINEANQAFRNQKTGFEYQNEGAMGTTGASANLIGRQIGRTGDLASNKLSAFSENLRAQQDYLQSLTSEATNRYNIAKGERSQIQDLITATKGKANITYTDSYESALQKAAKYEEKVQKEAEKKAKKEAEEAKKEAYKDNLRSQLQSMGASVSGLSTKALEKKLKKKMKEAGMADAEMKQIELALKKKELAKPYYKDEGDIKWNASNIKQGTAELIQEAKDKGLYGGYLWQYVEEEAKKVGIPTYQGGDFDKIVQKLFEQ